MAGFLCGKTAEQKQIDNLYPLASTVTEINTKTDTVTVKDNSGNLWEFSGTEDWAIGDGCSLLMDTNRTNNIKDDIIVSTQYYYSDWSIPYCYSNLVITDWNTNGEEIAFMLSDGTELYATKSESIYNN